jgi:hypothetical protein
LQHRWIDTSGFWRAAVAWALAAVLGLGLALPCWAQAAGADDAATAAAGRGHVDQAQVQGGRLLVSGWAGAAQPQAFITNVIVRLDGREVYRGRMQRSERPDVVDATGRADWHGSGFAVRFQLPGDLPAGPQALAVDMRLGDGREFALGTDERTRRIDITAEPALPLALRLALALAAGLPLLVWMWPPRFAASPAALPPEGAPPALGRPGGGRMWPPRSTATPAALPPEGASPALGRPGGGRMWPLRSAASRGALPPGGAAATLARGGGWLGRWRDTGWPLAGALALSLALLVATGMTGSSLPLLLGAPAVTESDARTVWGEPRGVRSDEWQVLTPLALAQGAHTPRWPVVNRHLGQDGQNMLVVGMSGVPVAHVSAWARPATWGFFAFDARQALAWHWWLPWFGGFAACWALLMRLTGLRWRAAAALAACLVLAPYSVAFSGWPAYLLMFAATGLLAFDRLLHARSAARALGWGALLGWAGAGFALVLYPAWQISVATLCAPLALAWAWRERAHWRWGWAQTLGLALAAALAAALLWAWWADAREAVAAMRATVYPGQRASEGGGDIDRWFLLKGWLNPLTLHVDAPMVRSEAASYPFMWLATLLALGGAWWRRRRVDAVPLALLAFALFALTYQFVGWPAPLLRASQWSLVTTYRLDLALGLAQVLLLGWLLAPAARAHGQGRAQPVLAVLAALATLGQVAWELSRMPSDIADALPQGFVLLCALAAAGCAALLLQGRAGALLTVYGGWIVAAGIGFNPLVRAPAELALAPALRAAGLAPAAASGPRVAVVGERNWAMALPAAGVAVTGNVFYYPQPSLWRALDPQGAERATYNRYHRLLLALAPLGPGRPYRIESPRLDEVRLTLDPERFDFRLLGADYVLLPRAGSDGLQGNASLQPVAGDGHAAFVLLKVQGEPLR